MKAKIGMNTQYNNVWQQYYYYLQTVFVTQAMTMGEMVHEKKIKS